jgi:hypothetical protein
MNRFFASIEADIRAHFWMPLQMPSPYLKATNFFDVGKCSGALMPLAISLESLFRRNEVIDWNDVHIMFGDAFRSLDGDIIFRGDFPEYISRRPAVIDSDRTVTGDLIPETAWGSSLANLLAPASWAALRNAAIEMNHRVCELCGTQIDALKAHEVWEYDFSAG